MRQTLGAQGIRYTVEPLAKGNMSSKVEYRAGVSARRHAGMTDDSLQLSDVYPRETVDFRTDGTWICQPPLRKEHSVAHLPSSTADQ